MAEAGKAAVQTPVRILRSRQRAEVECNYSQGVVEEEADMVQVVRRMSRRSHSSAGQQELVDSKAVVGRDAELDKVLAAP